MSAEDRIILDSSCWIEYFLGSEDARAYAHHVSESKVIVPSLILFEVARTLLQQFEPEMVLRAVSLIKQQHVQPLTDGVALDAAQLAENLQLSSADAMVCASAMANHAVLYTHDEDLKGLENVEYLPKSTVQIQP
jgi:predicted nucleic acid-binding protein